MTHFKARNLTALLLVLILLVSMFSTTALAAEDEYITDFEAESEIIIEEEPTEELPEAEESSEEVPEIEESSEVSDAPTSGTIPGSNIQWELTDDGMLLISGSGGCAAFSSAADQPWAAVREQIASVFFEDPSLLSIYDLAYWFDGCVLLTTAEIPYTTPVIGTRAFYGCVSLTTIMTYYGDSVLTEIGADAFYLPYDSGSTLYIGYLIGYPESTVLLHTYDWTGSNRSSLYFMDVYSTNALTSVVGACPSCGKQSLQGTYVAQSHTSRGHAEYYECYLCHYTKYLGSYVYKNHGSGSYGSWTCPSCGSHSWVLDYESDATCTRNGYREYSCDCGQSKRETVYATGHNYSYGSWEQYSSSQHRRENYCRYCGATDYDYASHSYSYGSWSSAGSSQHSRSMTCRYCGYSDTQYASHSLSYGSWSSHSDTQHRRTGSCTTCSYSTTDYGAHTFSYGSWTDYSSTQHRRTKRCTSCAYSGYDYADHVDSNGDGVCDGCEREMSRFSVTVPASLTVTVSEHGVVYTATGAGIVNNSSSAVQVAGVTLRAENGWTIVPYATNMAAQKVDSKRIGFALGGIQTAATGKSEQLNVSSMTVSAGATLPLSYDAVVSASSAAINEQVLTIVFVVGWA